MSTRRACLRDEPFAICDVQFYYPHVGVLADTAREVIAESAAIIRGLHTRAFPAPLAVALRHAFIGLCQRTFFRQNDQQSASISLALVQNGGKTALGGNPAAQRGNLQRGRQSRGQMRASGSVAVDDIREQPVNRLVRGCLRQRRLHCLVAHHARDGSQRMQMHRPGVFRR